MHIFKVTSAVAQLVEQPSGALETEAKHFEKPRSRPGDLAKRIMDCVLVVAGLLFLAPFFLLVAALILAFDGRPVFFGQTRLGKGGRLFRCYKFRTMVRDADKALADMLANDPAAREEWRATQKLSVDPRVSCLGAFLRKSSLDELPQLWNVLKGDMSLVGPRPIVLSEAWHYGDRLGTYMSALPGITGLWQVSGRSDTTYEQRVDLDCDYVMRRSIAMDLHILLRTVRVVLFGHGAR